MTTVNPSITNSQLVRYGATIADYSLTIECNWWVNGIPEPHNSQIESANMAEFVNILKILTSLIDGVEYTYERVPKQSQAC